MHFVFSLFAVIIQLSAPLDLIAQDTTSAYANMVRIPSGSFSMGGDAGLMDGGSQSHQTAYPIHEITVDAFWMDVAEVTNRQFADFVEATGYVTFAERPLPEADLAVLQQVAEASIRHHCVMSFSERSSSSGSLKTIEPAVCPSSCVESVIR